jgi:hypothetical protein
VSKEFCIVSKELCIEWGSVYNVQGRSATGWKINAVSEGRTCCIGLGGTLYDGASSSLKIEVKVLEELVNEVDKWLGTKGGGCDFEDPFRHPIFDNDHDDNRNNDNNNNTHVNYNFLI